MIYFSIELQVQGFLTNNPSESSDGDPNRWYLEWQISLIPSIRIGHNEDTKDFYRSVTLEWMGMRFSIHYIRPTNLQKQEQT